LTRNNNAVGLCTLNQVDPYPITYSFSNPQPVTYQVKNRFQKFAFQIQLAALQRGGKCPPLPVAREAQACAVRGVALQVAFERQTLKPVFHLIGYRLWV
jgi:hypothetical protein